MINHIAIRNFKSLKDVSFNCRRVNIIIGEPNAGKSNLLEALAVFALLQDNSARILRYQTVDNLFFDGNVSEPIHIEAGGYRADVKFSDGTARIQREDSTSIALPEFGGTKGEDSLTVYQNGNVEGGRSIQYPFRYYKFAARSAFNARQERFLAIPDGDNLFDVLHTQKELRETVATILNNKGYRLNLRMATREIELVKDENGILYSYPYQSVSDTLQRVIFYLAALESNSDTFILLEEPEAHTFPFYTKFLAERIAFDERNQYCIVTHNPYFLLSLVEKTPLPELAVFVASMENYQTIFRPLSDDEVGKILDLNTDVFFNLDTFLPEV